MDKFEALVSSLPLADEIKEAIKTADELGEVVKTAFEGYDKTQADQARELLMKNPEFTKQFIDQGAKSTEGKIKGTIDNQLKSVFGDSIKFEDERGKMPYSKVFEQIKEMQSKQPAKGSEDLHRQLIEKNKLIEQMKESHNQELTGLKDSYTGQLSRIKATDKLKDFLGDTAKLAISEHNVLSLASGYLDRSFKWGLSDEGGFFITNLDGSPVTNQAGTQEIAPNDIIANFLKSEKLIKESNGDPGKGKPIAIVKDGAKPESPGLQKLAAHVEEWDSRTK